MLDSTPARPLTSREISKIISSVLCGLVDWCGAEAVCDAMDHFNEHSKKYKDIFKTLENMPRVDMGKL